MAISLPSSKTPTNSITNASIYQHLKTQGFSISEKVVTSQILVSDTTYVSAQEGWPNLAAIMDLKCIPAPLETKDRSSGNARV